MSKKTNLRHGDIYALGVSDRGGVVNAGVVVADPERQAKPARGRKTAIGAPGEIPLWQAMARAAALRDSHHRAGNMEGAARQTERLNELGRDGLPCGDRVLADVVPVACLPESLALIVALFVPGKGGDGVGTRQGSATVTASLAWGCVVVLYGFEDQPEGIQDWMRDCILMSLEQPVRAW